jgi:hypothetical protein
MATTRSHGPQTVRQAVVSAASLLLVFAAGFATLIAVGSWWSACRDGTFERCLNGHPSFELVFQVALAAAGLAATLVLRTLVKRRSYRLAGVTLAVAVLLFCAWAVFLDAATHGWDDLKLLWLGLAELPTHLVNG